MYNLELTAGNQKITSSVLVGTSVTKRSPHNLLLCEDIVHERKYPLIFHFWTVLFRSYSDFNRRYVAGQARACAGNHDNTLNLKAVKAYKNFKEDRVNILKDGKYRSGVYCLINNINGHSYVGSAINLANRMRNYLNNSFLKSKQNINMPITKALLKYNQSNFTLLILEYVDSVNLTARETYYITLVLPYYNVLKQAYSSLGYTHTEETKKILSELAKNRTHSDQTKGLIARAVTGENNPFYNKNHSVESKLRIIEAKSAYPVYVYNSFKELLVIFPSVKTLAKLIKSNHSTLVNIIKDQTIFRGEWHLINIPYNINDTPKIAN